MKKSILILILTVISIFIIVRYFPKSTVQDTASVETNTPIDMCYFYEKETTAGLFDRSWVILSIVGSDVTGEFYSIPAEKDAKTGSFVGNVGPVKQQSMSRTASLLWNSSAEGVNVQEQLAIEFGDGSAVALYGEMVDRGDGIYMYKDTNALTPGFNMWQIDCMQLIEKITALKK